MRIRNDKENRAKRTHLKQFFISSSMAEELVIASVRTSEIRWQANSAKTSGQAGFRSYSYWCMDVKRTRSLQTFASSIECVSILALRQVPHSVSHTAAPVIRGRRWCFSSEEGLSDHLFYNLSHTLDYLYARTTWKYVIKVLSGTVRNTLIQNSRAAVISLINRCFPGGGA